MNEAVDFLQAVAPGLLSGIGAALAFVARISSRVTRVETVIEEIRTTAIQAQEDRIARDARIEKRLDDTRDSLCRIEGRLGVKR
jgi:hypothetical protein